MFRAAITVPPFPFIPNLRHSTTVDYEIGFPDFSMGWKNHHETIAKFEKPV
jgi:hypothetical protein